MQEDPLIGRQLGNYIIERVIGRGGMAVVYFGRDIKLNRPAAVKVIDTRFRDQPSYTGRFLQEARMAASWRHEHILQIYYADDTSFPDLGKLFYFAMEYIDGQNLAEILAQRIKASGSVPPADVLKYGRAVAAALDYAHQRGVIHRDVKPANILVSTDGRVVLSDFGLALEMQHGSVGEVFGSAHYIAPEQARRSSEAVPQSDLYALGVILYEMLTGIVPFDDPSPTSVALQHITLPPPRPRDLNPDLPPEVEAVLLKALAKKPEERYASGAALMAALETALLHTPVTTPTHKQIAEADQASQTAPFLPALAALRTRLSALPTAPRKIALAAAGLAVIACLMAAVSIRIWQAGKVNPSTITPSAAAFLTQPEVTFTPDPSPTTAAPTFTVTAASVPTTALPPSPTASSVPPTPSPTDTPPPPSTETAVPTPAVVEPTLPQPTVTWTPRYASGRRMVLTWNDSSFYMLQVTGYGELIDPLAFERIEASGIPANRFSARAWSEMHAATLRDWCMRLEIGGPSQPGDLPAFLRPAACEEHYLATRWPVISDGSIFWTRQEGSSQFRVLWGREEIQRCEISAGTCEVYLP